MTQRGAKGLLGDHIYNYEKSFKWKKHLKIAMDCWVQVWLLKSAVSLEKKQKVYTKKKWFRVTVILFICYIRIYCDSHLSPKLKQKNLQWK